ncbi:MAG TPA: TlpA disulfide reductase family protein [Bacteroidia bacterium]|nr:TlpA disulfide reductase family protein [Bacteroidia bacterium]
MKYTLVFFFVICFSFLSVAQQVVIKGSAPSYEYKEINVWAVNDYISHTQRKLTYSTIDSAGNFLLELSTKEIQYITLQIDKSIASMYIEPNGSYDVIMQKPDSTTYHNKNLTYDVELSIKLKSKTEINALTMDYDKRFDDFLTFYYPEFVKRSPKTAIDSFKLAIQKYYEDVKNEYLNTYVNYSIASLKGKTHHDDQKLFEAYLDKKPIQYNNPEYMNFFNTFFKDKLRTFSLTRAGEPLYFQINNRGSFKGAMLVLERDPFLKNDTIRELVLLKGLLESYYDNTFSKPAISAILKQITEESTNPVHQQIATNILNSFSKLKPGAAAPFFELPDKTGKTISLDELRTKRYIYLSFFDNTCSECLQEMKVMQALKKKYGERITFVSIMTTKSPSDLKNFCLKNLAFDWTFLYDNTGDLKELYEIKVLPSYFLINPEGLFIQAPAESPSGDIDRAFYDIVKPKAKRHNIGSKENN